MKAGNVKAGLFFAFLTALTFSLLEPVSKTIAGQINPYAITFIRFLIGALVLLPFSISVMKKQQLRLTGRDVLTLTALGGFMICTSMVLLQLAVKLSTSASVIAIVFCTNSMITILISSILFREKFTGRRILSMLLCAAGILLCVDFGGGNPVISVVLALVAALCFSIYTILSKRYMARLPGAVQTGFSFLLGSLVLLAVLGVAQVNVIEGVGRSTLLPLLVLGVLVTGLGYAAYFKAIEVSGPGIAAYAFFIKPVLSPFVSAAVNHTSITWKIILAALLVLAGSVLNSLKAKTK